ncbi:TniQ family protein [Roseateles sp.]|uniref:TniQ family protein n=1 Tax=Roseateles sp. TaxID=1971397 RepID=UPI0039C9AE64
MSVLLFGVPAPLPFEAPSSWLSRLALAQGCKVEEAKRFLGVPSREGRDVDRLVRGAVLAVVRQRCNLPAHAFAEVERFMDAAPERLWCASGWPRFHYCPLCLSGRPTAYLDVHWRPLSRRYCLVHGCLLENRCQGCQGSVTGPGDTIRTHAGREGHGSLGRCQRCCFNLASASPRFIDPLRALPFTQLELRLIQKPGLIPIHGGLALDTLPVNMITDPHKRPRRSTPSRSP